ncbi:CRISPR-associated helicase Cas3' [bacterium]|nr:CRISPR-associated helicase Cas3' [bacterium]
MKHALGKSDGTTLIEHIQDCLAVYSQLKEALPLLPKVTKLDNFWQLLFYVIYFHDWGKCHVEFQKVLEGKKSNYWNNQRHELYSIPFLDKLNLNENDKIILQRVVIGHHKTFFELLEKWKSDEDLDFELNLKYKRDAKYKKPFHPEDFFSNLKYNLLYDYLKYLSEKFPKYYQEHIHGIPINLEKEIKIDDLIHPLKQIVEPTYKSTFNTANPDYWQNLLLLGSMKLCDHYGSAGIKKINCFKVKDFSYLKILKDNLLAGGLDLYEHQKECFKESDNCILIAPTGSGKTESAIGWLKKQITISQGRVYYILPYTASINAMHKRLIKDFSSVKEIKGNNLIGIQHGKLTQYVASLYEVMSDDKKSILQKNEEIKKIRDIYKKMIYPLKVITPFQILKYTYGVKGFEMGFTELAGAKLVFDEIHAYDEITFAQILTSLEYFVKYFNCKIMIMTATLPTFMLEELKNTLGISKPVQASNDLLKEFTRHQVEIRDGDIFNQISDIKKCIRMGKRIIVVCNTVKNAQKIYEQLKDTEGLNESKVTLLHSRFNSADRNDKEMKALEKNNQLLIGTQAIEVSLDIDYDLMFTEPAPLDALLQRFGRVNRKREKGIVPIYVCNNGSKNDKYIYPTNIIDRTLELLNNIDIVHEEKLQDYLDFVYPNWDEKQFKNYSDTRIGFAESLKSLQPYTCHKENEEEFYDKFDGIQVLPACFFKRYKDLIKKYDFISAERLLVSIHLGMYCKLKNEKQIDVHCFEFETESVKSLKNYITIAKCHYNPQIGMTDEFEDINDNYNIF